MTRILHLLCFTITILTPISALSTIATYYNCNGHSIRAFHRKENSPNKDEILLEKDLHTNSFSLFKASGSDFNFELKHLSLKDIKEFAQHETILQTLLKHIDSFEATL